MARTRSKTLRFGPGRRGGNAHASRARRASSLLSGAFVGFSLGLVGGGGSILAVPLMIYVVGVAEPHRGDRHQRARRSRSTPRSEPRLARPRRHGEMELRRRLRGGRDRRRVRRIEPEQDRRRAPPAGGVRGADAGRRRRDVFPPRQGRRCRRAAQPRQFPQAGRIRRRDRGALGLLRHRRRLPDRFRA